MNFDTIPVTDILPQMPPFLMIDKLIHYDSIIARTELQITADNIFTHNGALSGYGIVENVAQTCAARIGYYTKYILGLDISIGYIGAVRGFEIKGLPAVGDKITTTIEVLQEVFNLTLVKATVIANGDIIAEGQMKIALNKN